MKNPAACRLQNGMNVLIPETQEGYNINGSEAGFYKLNANTNTSMLKIAVTGATFDIPATTLLGGKINVFSFNGVTVSAPTTKDFTINVLSQ